MNSYSEDELSLMGNSQVLLLKRQVIRKVSDDFSEIEKRFRQILESTSGLKLPEGTLKKAGKISKGENYKGLPYLVLDYPRLMTQEQVLNIRLLFWWGHYYSLSLHLAGVAWQRYRQQVIPSLASSTHQNLIVQYLGSPWEHDVSLPYFTRANKLTQHQLAEINEADFFRVINLLPLKSVEELEHFAETWFERYTSMLGS